MADDWEFKDLERRVGRLEKRLDEREQKSWERSLFWFQAVMWMLAVVYAAVIVVPAITHYLHIF